MLRVITVLVAAGFAFALSGCGSDEPPTVACARPPAILANIALNVDEAQSVYAKRLVKVRDGTAKFTVQNPIGAKYEHGIGIDGGRYDRVKGAPVRPGRATSLTVAVKPGRYTIFDSAKHHALRHPTRVVVTRGPRPDQPCNYLPR